MKNNTNVYISKILDNVGKWKSGERKKNFDSKKNYIKKQNNYIIIIGGNLIYLLLFYSHFISIL